MGHEVSSLRESKKVEEVVISTVTTGAPIKSLGPFKLLPCHCLNITLKSNGGYEAHISSSKTNLRQSYTTFQGSTSPPCAVNLSDEAKEKANIPVRSEKFLWAYPQTGAERANNLDDINLTAEEKFRLFGGYVYMSSDDTVLQVNAVDNSIGSDLIFDGPFYFNDNDKIASLRAQNRFQPITLAYLKDQGIEHYCWLLPNEKDSKGRVISTHGAFLYLSVNSHQYFFYFSVKDTSKVVWEYLVDGYWSSYSSEVAKKLEWEYTHGNTKVEQSPYCYNFVSMTVTHTTTNTTSTIRRSYWSDSTQFAVWSCLLRREWKTYSPGLNKLIEDAYFIALSGGDTNISFPQGVIANDAPYEIKFDEMKQVNQKSGFKREIKRTVENTLDKGSRNISLARRMMLSRANHQLVSLDRTPPCFGDIIFLVRGGRNLGGGRLIPNPYVVVSTNFSDFSWTSSPYLGSNNPNWMESCFMKINRDNSEGLITFTVFNQGFTSNSYLGRMSISLSQIVCSKKIEARKNLDYECVKAVGSERGQLELCITYTEQTKTSTDEVKPMSLRALLESPVMDIHLNMAKRDNTLINRISDHPITVEQDQFEASHGTYTLSETLGSGAYGTVMKGLNKQTNETVAIKIMNPSSHEDISNSANIEIQILHLLSDENCISVIESVQSTDGRIFIIMEYCCGDLFDSLPVTQSEAKRISIQVLKGLRYLHGAGICHRDIKPENIFRTSTGNWKIADFGVSAFFTNDAPRMTGLRGSIPYMAPEMFHSEYTKSVDIWAFGAALFVTLSGLFPWHASYSEGDPDEMMHAIMNIDIHWSECWDEMKEAREFLTTIIQPVTNRPTIETIFAHEWLT